MKIVIISNLYKPYTRGGAEKVVERTAHAFRDAGHEVVLVSTKPFKNISSLQLEEGEIDGMKIYRFFPANLYHVLNDYKYNPVLRFAWHTYDIISDHAFGKIRKVLRLERPDLIITHNLKGIGYTSALASRRYVLKNPSVKWVHTLHDIQLIHPSGLLLSGSEKSIWRFLGIRKAYESINKWLFDNPTMVVSPSRWLLDFHVNRGFFKNSIQQVILNPYASKAVEKSAGKRSELLFLGQLEKHKGIEWLIEQIDKRDDVRLHIAGTGSLEESIKKRIDGNDSFVFHGYVDGDNLDALMRSVGCVVIVSLTYENSPSVIVEAFAYGLPVLCVSHGGAHESIQRGVNGEIFDILNDSTFHEALSRILENTYTVDSNIQTGEHYTKHLLSHLKNQNQKSE